MDKNNKSQVEGKELKFVKMTPIHDLEIRNYEEALDYAFKEKDILNIAITGPYSSGKSSVISTYEKNCNKNTIHISLSKFSSDKVEEKHKILPEKEQEEGVTKNELEGSIINQLIHKIPLDRIPLSNFKIKPNVNDNSIRSISIKISIVVFSATYLLFFNTWKMHVSNIYFDPYKTLLGLSGTSGFYILVVMFFLYFIYRFINFGTLKYIERPFLKKVKLNNNEVELFTHEKDSVFDKYLDEIIYLIDKSEAEAIVFEDIDRYGDIEIFTKLREINILVNEKRKHNGDEKVVKFIYLLKDDMFNSKDRTKFFDFIIPIIPVIDSSNSFDKLKELLEEGNLDELLDMLFVERMCLYIDDMRLLKNVYNEFILYKNRLNRDDLDYNKLIALLVYKNIFPRDFADLQLNKGYVYSILSCKEKFCSDISKEYIDELKKLEDAIEQSEQEILEALTELDTIYYSSLNIDVNWRIDNKWFNNTTSNKDVVSSIRKNEFKVTDRYGIEKDIRNLFDNLQKDIVYKKRYDNILLKSKEKRNENLKRIKILTEKLHLIETSPLAVLIDEYDEDILYSYGYEKDYTSVTEDQYYKVIKYLIREGKIDESHKEYLTYFYANSITNNDKQFILALNENRGKEFNYKIDNVKYLVTKLTEKDFKKKGILNFDLLDYILDSNNKSIDIFIDCIYRNLDNKFVLGYIKEISTKKVDLIKIINRDYPDIFMKLLHKFISYTVDLDRYLYLTLTNCEPDNYIQMNDNNVIKDYIIYKADFFQTKYAVEPVDKLIIAFEKLGIKFIEIREDVEVSDLLREVYSKNLYKVNFEMIKFFLIKIYKIPESEEFNFRNYTLVSSKEKEQLKEYIDKNINEYFKIFKDNNKFTDIEEVAISLLNNNDLLEEYKIIYIKSLDKEVRKLDLISDESLYDCLLKEEKIIKSLYNITTYFYNMNEQINEVLIQFIEKSNDDEWDIKELGYYPEEFLSEALKEDRLSIKKYTKLMSYYHKTIEAFTITDISDDKVKVLIKNKIIEANETNIGFLRKNYPDLIEVFININIEKYVDLVCDKLIEVNEEEMLNILKDDKITDTIKLKVISEFNEEVKILAFYSDEIKSHIIRHNFEYADLFKVLKLYDNANDNLKKSIEELCRKEIETIIECEDSLSINLLRKILTLDIEEQNKKMLIINSLNEIKEEKLLDLFDLAGFNSYVQLLNGGRPKIEYSNEDEQILNYLKKNNLIINFSLQDDNFYFTTYGIPKKGSLMQ